mmetsp:Transcript_13220/g.19447  ORF Transcript_13220/g.19447 Transcript_13220/m.19447 type:complete len:368 (-) Transcript_13220:68-1171(-)
MQPSISQQSGVAYTNHYPNQYVAPYLNHPLSKIDGDLTKREWELADWSDFFQDIRGFGDAPNKDQPPSTCSTRVKMLWDDDYLYIGAILETDNTEYPVVTTFRKRNEPIFQQDSDFEVFVDPTSTTHNYKEFEANAWNTIWNLMLDKPYSDGGAEHSGRVAKDPNDPFYYEVKDQTSATKIVEGELNASQGRTKWSIEIKMSFQDLLASTSNRMMPGIGTRWRINFSRVERKGLINWVWQPQIQWNGTRYKGEVNMHLPNAWGYLVFGKDRRHPSGKDPEWPLRMAAMNIYVAQHLYFDKYSAYASSLEELKPWLDRVLMKEFPVVSFFECSNQTFIATIRDDIHQATIRNDRFLQVEALLVQQQQQ